jgi:type IV secretory pathway TraG/TraD family ATPase VirD4
VNIFKKQKLGKNSSNSVESLYKLLTQTEHKKMHAMLKGTSSGRHFVKDNEKTAASIMSVLMTNVKPLRFLRDESKVGMFSIGDYLQKINSGGNSWLFLSTDPSARELTIPLNASLLELLISRMRATRTNAKHNLWIVMDELPALGKLPSLTQLMQEGRKYGSCVLAAMQSISQLYKHYGEADASNLIGLFKTKFAFASDDPKMGDLYSKLCGSVTTIGQQKNISFGANEFRDGVSYNERKEKSPLVSYEDFGKLAIGECYAILPVSAVRLSKIQVPRAKILDKNSWFIETEEDFDVLEDLPEEAQDANELEQVEFKFSQ